MTNPFEGKAVKFDTEEQLDHLAELAKGYGLYSGNNEFSALSYRHFRKCAKSENYSNYKGNNDLPVIHYSDFVASIEAVKSNHSEQHLDMVNHPKHYNVNGFEVIDIIDAFGLNFNMGNALKYLLRADRKGNKKQDIEKAIWYLQRENKTKLNVIGA